MIPCDYHGNFTNSVGNSKTYIYMYLCIYIYISHTNTYIQTKLAGRLDYMEKVRVTMMGVRLAFSDTEPVINHFLSLFLCTGTYIFCFHK